MKIEQLQACCITEGGKQRSVIFAPLISSGQTDLLTTPYRLAAFVAQVLHESAEFRYLAEIASGEAYEGRADLGNTEPGDGPRFKGRGLIQITGRANYQRCGKALGLDLVNHPEQLEDPAYATASALWFWRTQTLNLAADQHNFAAITRRINGGMNGWADRLMYLANATRELTA